MSRQCYGRPPLDQEPSIPNESYQYPQISSSSFLNTPSRPISSQTGGSLSPERTSVNQESKYVTNPNLDVSKRLHICSGRGDDAGIWINGVFAADWGESWISEDLVSRLRPEITPCSQSYGELDKRTIKFLGTVSLKWTEMGSGKSNYEHFRVVQKEQFEVFLPKHMLSITIHPALHTALPTAPCVPILRMPDVPIRISSLSISPPLVAVPAGSFDAQSGEDAEDAEESGYADDWFTKLTSRVHSKIDKGGERYLGIPIKIAVLDTGIDRSHSLIKGAIRQKRINEVRSFVNDDDNVDDRVGHGTHVTALVLKVAPEAQVYIAKVANGEDIPSDHNIANAIRWAVELDVDIITMSFGLENDNEDVQKAILKAYKNGIIMFAAASNQGGNEGVKYPAKQDEVICIYATDGMGKPYGKNPSPLPGETHHFATVGVAVNSAWPKKLHEDATSTGPEKRQTGTSFATPIAAGVAACVLEFARMNELDEAMYKRLRSRQTMKQVFANHLTTPMAGFHYISPWKLFDKPNASIFALLEDRIQEF